MDVRTLLRGAGERRRSAPALAAVVATTLVAGGAVAVATAVTATGSPAGDSVVINEAYLSGGSANAPYRNKFVELYNPTGAPVSLDGWSLQYRAATSTANPTGVYPLSGTIAAHGYFLVAGNSNGTTGAALPTPDATTGFTPSGTTGTIALVSQPTAAAIPTGSLTTAQLAAAGVVDLLGYGTSNTHEGGVAAAPASNSVPASIQRAGFADTDDNAADFHVDAAVTPQGSQPGTGTPTPTDSPTQTPTPTPTPTDTGAPVPLATIEDVQGTGDASPLVGQKVRVRGIVTAAYPTGGFNGLYLQAPGTGGDVDLATHHASDGVFVYSSAAAAALTVGQYAEVTGTVSEYQGLTEVSASSWQVLDEAAPAVKPANVVYPTTDAQRESLEGMLVAPAGTYTVADNYDANYYGELTLASGTTTFTAPTQAGRPGSPEAAAAVADHDARAVLLDDGSSWTFSSTSHADSPLPYLTGGAPVRVGAKATFTKPVILDYRYDAWGFQPTAQLVGVDAAVDPATFEDTRAAAPTVAGTLHVSSFNVLNYFTTTGDQLSGCSFYKDRLGNPITVNTGCAARGAANAENLARQQAKIVNAINGLGADVVSLEEIENSLTTAGLPRDASLAQLVDALNAAAGAGTWKYVPSPSQVPTGEDVIRVAFIYKPAKVAPVGDSKILIGAPAFDIAREPLAQTWRPVGGSAADDVVVVSNHFKSKGADAAAGPGDVDTGDGAGGFNATRVAQAHAVLDFANQFAQAAGTDKILLVGDFNAYGQEDPVQAITDAGYTDLGATTGKQTYLFDGYVGSLDHAFASAALAPVATADIWNVNSVEPIANEYSRYDYNVSNLYDTTPFRSSDHDPILVGLDLPLTPPKTPVAVRIKAIQVVPFCSGGQVYLSTSAVAGEPKHALDIRLTTSFGDQKFTKVAPLTSVSQVFATGRSQVAAGKLSVAGYWWDGVGHYQVDTKDYKAKDCAK